jgi:chemotaxis family two-component system response regulator Rcp1
MTVPETVKPVEILLGEDNPGDVRLTREAFKESRFDINLSVATNGEAVLAYLRQEGKYAQAARPDLILLDLSMPRKDGFSVLSEIKQDPDLDCISVIVLTSSHAEQDIVKSYKLRASCYISKPADVSVFNAEEM